MEKETLQSDDSLPSPPKRSIFYNDDVDAASIGSLTKEILSICEQDEHLKNVYALHGLVYEPKPIKLYINTYGGDLYACLGVLPIISYSSTPVHTIVTGAAMSAGFLIATAGKRRFCYPTSTFMFHQVSQCYSANGDETLKEITENAAEMKRIQKMAEEHVIAHTKISKEELKKIYNAKKDSYFSPEKALALGIVDEIIGVVNKIVVPMEEAKNENL